MLPPNRSARDHRYLNCTSFEVYIIAGLVFLFGFTLTFIVSVAYHIEPMLWPGSVLTIILAYVVFDILKRRERRAKLREIEDKPSL